MCIFGLIDHDSSNCTFEILKHSGVNDSNFLFDLNAKSFNTKLHEISTSLHDKFVEENVDYRHENHVKMDKCLE
jgi:hypothetical protein